jgi:DNA-nicking Smr family endonuclease
MARRDLPPRTLNEEEQQLWQQAITEVKPLAAMPGRAASFPSASAPMKRRAPQPMPSSSSHPEPVANSLLRRPVHLPDERLDPQLKRRMRRGILTPEARIDLHGLNEETAFTQLSHFIEHCVRVDRRFVLVITGKGAGGKGKLRENFARWMEVSPLSHLVQAFEPAQPRDGGTGAFYVKLRRTRD